MTPVHIRAYTHLPSVKYGVRIKVYRNLYDGTRTHGVGNIRHLVGNKTLDRPKV